jgi:hypothetical protein
MGICVLREAQVAHVKGISQKNWGIIIKPGIYFSKSE